MVEKSSNCSWYKGWKETGQSGFTLLEALDVSLLSFCDTLTELGSY